MAVAKAIWSIRRARILKSMAARNRVTDSATFTQEMEANRGTLIIDQASKAGALFWWTPDNILQQSPHPPDTNKPLRFPDISFELFYQWCNNTYTDQENGTALLISGTSDQLRSLVRNPECF
jgi:hypothetical protein